MRTLDHIGADAPGLAAPERLSSLDPICVASVVADAVAPAGLSPPRNDDAPRLAGAEGIKGQGKTDTGIVADLDGQRKAFLTDRRRSLSRTHPLLFSACTCSLSRGALCLTCRRWRRHHVAVMQRLRAWRAAS